MPPKIAKAKKVRYSNPELKYRGKLQTKRREERAPLRKNVNLMTSMRMPTF